MRLMRPDLRLCLLLLFGAASGTVLGSRCATATPLDEETCTRLKAEQAELAKAGAEANMERGAVWAKANLTPDKLKEIGRFIELQEQILFRCPQPKRPEVVETEEEAPAQGAAKTKKPAAKAAAVEAGATQPKPKPKEAVAPGGAATKAGSSDLTASAAKKPAAKPKPKANDAYIPPVKLDGE